MTGPPRSWPENFTAVNRGNPVACPSAPIPGSPHFSDGCRGTQVRPPVACEHCVATPAGETQVLVGEDGFPLRKTTGFHPDSDCTGLGGARASVWVLFLFLYHLW